MLRGPAGRCPDTPGCAACSPCLSRLAPLQAGDKLVVLEIQSEEQCQTGYPEAELQWKADKSAAMERCRDLKHSFARTARECGDVVFLAIEVRG